MIRLHDILDLPDLGLTAVFTPSGPSPEVRWAHVSELVDPSAWLLGNEMLLTTGFALEDNDTAWDEYCSRIKLAGVSVLGMSTGSSLPYTSLPAGLKKAAQTHNLALVHVPHDTLLQSVVQKVSDALYEAVNQDLLRSFSVQRQLSEAASSDGGIGRIIQVLSRTLNLRTVVLDERLRTLATINEAAEAAIEPIRGELKTRLREGLRWSISEEGHDHSLVVLPLGTEGRLSGVLACTKQTTLTIHDRAALGLAASLLGVLLERRQVSEQHRRVMESQLLGAIVKDNSKVGDLQTYLGRIGVHASQVEVLCTSNPEDEFMLEQFITNTLEHCEETLVTRDGDNHVFAFVNPTQPLTGVLRGLVLSHHLGPAGLGDRRAFSHIAESLAQAQFARTIAISRDLPFIERIDTGGYRALMLMGSHEARQQFADSVLKPLDIADEGKRSELFKTVHAYVSSLGNHEQTAEALNVHRHTVRARLARISELTGRDLSVPEDFLELWMASEFRISSTDERAVTKPPTERTEQP